MKIFFNNFKNIFLTIIFLILFCTSLTQAQSFSSSGIIYLSPTNLLTASTVERELIRTKIEAGTPVIYEGSGNKLITALGLQTYIVPRNDNAYYFALLKLPSGFYKMAQFHLADRYEEEYSIYPQTNTIFNKTESKRIIITDDELTIAKQGLLNKVNEWVNEKLTANVPENMKSVLDQGAWNSIGDLEWHFNCIGSDGNIDAIVTTTATAFKIQDSFALNDWYLIETRLHHQILDYQEHFPTPCSFSTKYTGWYVQTREIKNLTDPNNPDISLAEYGPTSSVGSSTTTISIGGSIVTDPGAGINASYSRTYSTPDVDITDQSSISSKYGYWKEKLLCPEGNYSLWPIVDWPCTASKSSFFSYQSIIYKTTDLVNGIPVIMQPKSKIYRDKIVDHCVYFTLTRYLYNVDIPNGINVFYNYPPNPPVTPSGPSTIWINEPASFSTSGSDPDGNSIEFQYAWDPNVYSLWGNPIQTYIWTEGGDKGIRVKARDLPFHFSDWSPTFNIHVKSITRIEISGPDQINSNSYGQYNCTAYYTDNTTMAITPTWSISSGSQYASIDSSGRLTPNNITQTQSITVLATYTDHGKTVEISKSIQINFVTSVEELAIDIPSTYKLFQNYPNPFNPSTVLRFALPQRSRVFLSIFDALGKEVSRPLNGAEMNAGTFELPWAGKDVTGNTLASGLYIMKIIATTDSPEIPDYVNTKKLLLLK